MLPSPCQRRQHGHRTHCIPAVFRPLHPIVHAQRRWPCRCVLSRQPLNLARGHSGPRGHPLRRILARPLGKLRKPMRHLVNVGAVFQALVENHLHHPQRQRRIRPRTDRNMPIGQRRRSCLVRIDHNQPRPIPPRLLHHRPQVNVVAVDICAPRQHQPGQPKVLRRHAQLLPVNQLPRLTASLRANRPIQLARSQPMKEPPVHRPESEHANGSRVAVGQNRLRPKLLRNPLQPLSNRDERLIPTDALKGLVLLPALERTFGHAWFPLQREKNPLRRIHPVKILGYLAAQEPLRHRMRRVARHLHGASLCVHRNQNPAAVRAVVRTHRMHHAKWGRSGSRGHAAIVSPHLRAYRLHP